jgi:hypothetical protein
MKVSREIYPEVLTMFPNEKVGEIKAANLIKPIHLLDVNGMKDKTAGKYVIPTESRKDALQ